MKAETAGSKQADTEESLEENLSQVEAMISRLEQSDISLEEAFSIYENGMKKIKECNDKIDKVEKQMLVLNGQDDFES